MSIEDDLKKIEEFHKKAREEDLIDPAEEARLRRLIRAEKDSAISMVVSGVMHDSNGFITPILGAAEMGKMRAQQIQDAELVGNFDLILEAADKLRRMMSNLLDFSKRKDYTRGEVYINSTLENVVHIYRPQYLHERINLQVDLSEVPVIDGYQDGLAAVFSNMLANAMQAYEGISRERPKNTQVRSYHKEGHIFVEFTDDGKGITQEDLPHIFDMWYSTKENGHGMGLAHALMIVKNIHFGKIFVDSEYGQGTKFTIKLPDKATLKLMRDETFFGFKREPSS